MERRDGFRFPERRGTVPALEESVRREKAAVAVPGVTMVPDHVLSLSPEERVTVPYVGDVNVQPEIVG